MVGMVIVRCADDALGATVLWVRLALVGRVDLFTSAWRHSRKHTIGQSMSEKNLTVASGNLSDQVLTFGEE